MPRGPTTCLFHSVHPFHPFTDAAAGCSRVETAGSTRAHMMRRSTKEASRRSAARRSATTRREETSRRDPRNRLDERRQGHRPSLIFSPHQPVNLELPVTLLLSCSLAHLQRSVEPSLSTNRPEHDCHDPRVIRLREATVPDSPSRPRKSSVQPDRRPRDRWHTRRSDRPKKAVRVTKRTTRTATGTKHRCITTPRSLQGNLSVEASGDGVPDAEKSLLVAEFVHAERRTRHGSHYRA